MGTSTTEAVTLVAVGDLMVGDSPLPAGYGFHSRYPGRTALEALEGLRPVLAGHDIVFGNLEAQLSTRAEGRTRLARGMMRGDPVYATLLRELGFNVLAVANNHAMQHGPAAFDDSVAIVRATGIDVAGLRGTAPWTSEPVRRTVRGVTVGILGYSFRPRQYGTGEPAYATGSQADVLADVQRLAADTQRVVVSLHWGEEFVAEPSMDEVGFARELMDAGATLILGHHPHVARPIVRYRRAAVAYSLGNAVSDMVWQPGFVRGLAVQCTLAEGGPELRAQWIATDRRYRVRATGEPAPIRDWTEVPGLAPDEYEHAIALSMRRYRRAALRHMIVNAWRSPLPITAELFVQKTRNLAMRLTLGERT